MAAARLEIFGDGEALAAAAARFVADRARDYIEASGRFTFAVSGGRTPWAMFDRLIEADLAWERIHIYQVDERIAPDGDPDRNLTQLLDRLPPLVSLHPMPVTSADISAAAREYAASLPARFDLIHLGLGTDGHTASLVPGDPVLAIDDQDVGVTREYMGHRRMTLTYPVINRASGVLWLVSGSDKVDALARLLSQDQGIPAGRVAASDQLVFADRAAHPSGDALQA